MISLLLQGTVLRIHFLFWVVILSSVVTGQFMEVTTLFVLVLIHELGHVTAARSFGWRIHSIELLPFGGVAHTDEWGTVPAREEIVVALAGPFHNVIMVLFGLLFYQFGWWSAEWTEYFVKGNAMLAGFNLLPIYPLDGGRILQALLSYVFPYRRAVVWSLGFGFAGAAGLFLFSLSGEKVQINLSIVALFLFYSNWIAMRQRDYQYMRFLMHRREHRVPDSAPIIQLPVRPEEPLLTVLKRFRKEAYHVVVVQKPKGGWATVPEEAVFRCYFDEKRIGGLAADLIA
ncbi:M50 family metallopeptidase [Salinithrix halophila]|uniref:M50 family metallopeptidase n=1 Tax=Salinithrix halophila TaxID=1485204 RepID=A0ABV8JJ45_9BACL